MKRIAKKLLFIITVLFILIPAQTAFAETLEERLNNLVGPIEQYNTMLSPVYLRNNVLEETISTQSGELSLAQTDYVLPGRNGLDLEIKRLYKSGISNVREMKVKYVNGAWVDYVEAGANTSSFYEDRYDLGIGMRFSFPAIEIRQNEDGSSHKFLHTETGDIYRLTGPTVVDGIAGTYLVENQTVKDVVVREDNSFSNGQPDGTSKYVMVGNDGKKTFFTEDGRVVGIRDRYGNTITFEYSSHTYTIDGVTRTKKLISKIIDTVGRVVTFEYKADYSFKAGPKTETHYSKEESWKESQNPNDIDSGDLKGKFQVLVHLPGNKTLVYDKSAVLLGNNKNVIRTRLQRVFDVDGEVKYHFWYEQTDLGFTYTNGSSYSVYNRYENLVQIDFCKTNKIIRYTYDTKTRGLADNGSLQYRKISSKKELAKKDYNALSGNFLDRFICDEKNRINYTYTNEADGYGFSGYKPEDEDYLRNVYRYTTKKTEKSGLTTLYTYNGLHELVSTEETGINHKEIVLTEHDEKKFPKKKETLRYNVVNSEVTGQPVKIIENYRYDEYGNLTNYTGPIANRDANGYPTDIENTVIYSYAYDKFHVPQLKTWKSDSSTTYQIKYDIDEKGNVVRQTDMISSDASKWIITDFNYDSYGNLTRKVVYSPDRTYITNYEYSKDFYGVDHKGAMLTREYTIDGSQEKSRKFAYNFNTGDLIAEEDGLGNRTTYDIDVLGRVTKQTMPDGSVKKYEYRDLPYADREIEYTDPEGTRFLYTYDISGNLLTASVFDKNKWNTLKSLEYDSNGNKIKEKDANGHSVRFTYDLKNRLTAKAYYERDSVKKAQTTLEYSNKAEGNAVLLLTVTDEEGYRQKFWYDANNNLVKSEMTPDNAVYYTTTFEYDFTGNKIRQTDARNNSTTFKYDGLGRLVSTTDAQGNTTSYTYTGMNKVLTITEPGDKVTAYVFDGHGRVSLEKVYKKGSEDYNFKRFIYDNADNVLIIRQGNATGGSEIVLYEISYQYNKMNLATDVYQKVDTGLTAHVKYEYDKNGRKTAAIEYANNEESNYRRYEYSYDFAGRLISEKGAYVAADGTGDAAGYGSYEKKFEYDYAGNLKKQEVLGGNGYVQSVFTYDYRNRLVAKEEPFTAQKSKVTSYSYDKKGNLLTETLKIQGVECVTSYQYDGLGRVVAQVSPTGGITRNIYDEMNNLVKQILPQYYSLPASTAPGTEYVYDSLNRQTLVISFDGIKREVITYREYDARGNVIKEADSSGYNADDPQASIGALFEYDIYDNTIKYISAQTAAVNTAKGIVHHTVKSTYDGLNRLIAQEDAYGNITQLSYYMNGKLKEKKYPDGSKESFAYDLTGKIMEIYTDKGGNLTRVYRNIFDKPYRIEYPDNTFETYKYSPDGNLVESTDRAGNKVYYEYNPDGTRISQKDYVYSASGYDWYRLLKYTYDEAGKVLSAETYELGRSKSGESDIIRATGDRTVYSYDKAGKLIRTLGPNGKESINVYDINGSLVKQLQRVDDTVFEIKRYTYNARLQMTGEAILVKPSDILAQYLTGVRHDAEYSDMVLCETTYEYYGTGKLKSKKDAAGNTTTYHYDYDGRIILKEDPLHHTAQYKYDLSGNLIEEKNDIGAVTSYDYDSMNRLIRKKTPAADSGYSITRYIYDISGNLKKVIQPNNYDENLDTASGADSMQGVSYAYDTMNRRIKTIAPDGQVLEALEYGAKGNVIKVVDGLRFNGNVQTSPGTVYTYDGLNRVTKTIDALGGTIEYEYDILGNVKKQTDARGNSTEFQYNADGTLARITYPDGGIVEFTYDRLGRLLTRKSQNGNITKYEYNGFGKLRKETDPYGYTFEYKYDLNGNEVSVKDKRGGITLIKYDALNRVSEKKTPLEVDGSGNTVYSIERYEYDSAGNLYRKILTGTVEKLDSRVIEYTYYPNNLVKTITDSIGAVTTNYYDRNGNVVKVVKSRSYDKYDIEKYEYDIMNRLVKSIMLVDESDIFNAASMQGIEDLRDSEYPGKICIVTAYEYDILGNKTKEILPKAYQDTASLAAYTISYSYDILNRLEKITRKHNGSDVYTQYYYDANGNRIKIRDERGNETVYTYDEMNRLIATTDAMGGKWTSTYDKEGNKLSDSNPKGDTISYAYDKLNRQITVIDAFGVVVTRNIYDASGNIIETRDAKNNATTYKYDLANRLLSYTDPEAAAQGSYTESYRYNQYGEKTRVTDALGNKISYEYDKAGRLVRVTDALGISTTYTYDLAGNKTSTTDGRGKVTEYTYGAFGSLTSMTDADGRTMTYKYDLAGNTALIVDRNGSITIYTYDNGNRLTEKINASTGDSISYIYDAAGNRTGMSDESGNYSYSYDANNRLIKITKGSVEQIAYSYDTAGNIIAITDIKGNITEYTYDKSNRMKTVTFNNCTVTYEYDINGNRESITYDGGVTETYTYDRNNRLIALTNKRPDGSEISTYSYTYDLAGRQTGKTDSFGTSTYTYDSVGRIIKAETPGKTSIYSYDRSGNRISMNETYTSPQTTNFIDELSGDRVQYILKKSQYVYDNVNRLVKLVEEMYDENGKKVLTKTTQYVFDANGNQISEYASYVHPSDMKLRRTIKASVYGDGQPTSPEQLIDRTINTYDGFNRLKKVERLEDGIRSVVEYLYNGDGLRMEKTVRKSDNAYTPVITSYLYDRQHVILEIDEDGSTTARYIRGINYIAKIADGESAYFLYNGHGDVVQTVTEAGEVLNEYDYDIFGNPMLTIETAACSIRYAGEYLDNETGLYYLRARYYEPYIGRFISEDSYWGEDSNPLSLNLYTYAYNDPVLCFLRGTNENMVTATNRYKKTTLI